MEIIFVKIRASMLVIVVCNIINEMTTQQICIEQVIVAPIALLTYFFYLFTLLAALPLGGEMNRLSIGYFDCAAVFLFSASAWVIATHKSFEFRTFQDPVVMNAFLPIVLVFLAATDLMLMLTYKPGDYDD